jgi:hypothetical protein
VLFRESKLGHVNWASLVVRMGETKNAGNP